MTGRESSEDGNALDLVHYEDGAPEHCGYGADAHEIDYCVCDLFHLYPPSFFISKTSAFFCEVRCHLGRLEILWYRAFGRDVFYTGAFRCHLGFCSPFKPSFFFCLNRAVGAFSGLKLLGAFFGSSRFPSSFVILL